MKFISSMYMPRRNFWCMTRGDSSHLNFQLQKVDWGPSGRQNWRKTIEFWKILYIHFIRDPKDIAFAGFFLRIKSHAKRRWSTVTSPTSPTSPTSTTSSTSIPHFSCSHITLKSLNISLISKIVLLAKVTPHLSRRTC